MNRLPDGSGFFTASFPLPKGHWLHKVEDEYRPPPIPYPMKDGVFRQDVETRIIEAARWAIKAATGNGEIKDFDPDALVQNLLIGLFGYYTVCEKVNNE